MAKSRICAAPSCGKPSRGTYCSAHYKRLKKYGSFELPSRIPQGCKVEGCEQKHDAKGYCKTHYLRLRRHGDPERLVQGKAVTYLFDVVLAHDEDKCLFWPFGRNGHGYAQVRYEGKD